MYIPVCFLKKLSIPSGNAAFLSARDNIGVKFLCCLRNWC